MTETHRFSVSVAGAVIRDDGKVLAIKRRDNGEWEPPGGVIEPGETIVEGLVREVQEETGIRVTPGPLSGVYQNMDRDIVSLVFRCNADSGSIRSSDESSQVEWLDADEIRTLMNEAYAVRLLDALADPKEAPVRTHDGVSLMRTAQ